MLKLWSDFNRELGRRTNGALVPGVAATGWLYSGILLFVVGVCVLLLCVTNQFVLREELQLSWELFSCLHLQWKGAGRGLWVLVHKLLQL